MTTNHTKGDEMETTERAWTPGRPLSNPERFSGYSGDIEDQETADRIEVGQAWRVQHMADRINDMSVAAARFMNAVFEGRAPDFDDLSNADDVALGAMYEWAKNNARLEGWTLRKINGDDTDDE
jgi:hypothetical protein